MVQHSTFTLTAERETVTQILQWVHSIIGKKRLFPQEKRKIELALEEAIVNVLEHAYDEKGGGLDITIEDERPGEVGFVLKYGGPEFDPLSYTARIQAESRVGEEQGGGLGVLLMCRAMDHLEYAREGGMNVLTLTKILRKPNK